MALCPDVASLTVNQLDRRNLLWRSVIRYGTRKIWYWPLLMTLVVARLGTGLSITETASGLTALGGSLMTIQIDQNRHPGFLQSGQLTLFGAAIIVLLIFAWSYAQ